MLVAARVAVHAPSSTTPHINASFPGTAVLVVASDPPFAQVAAAATTDAFVTLVMHALERLGEASQVAAYSAHAAPVARLVFNSTLAAQRALNVLAGTALVLSPTVQVLLRVHLDIGGVDRYVRDGQASAFYEHHVPANVGGAALHATDPYGVLSASTFALRRDKPGVVCRSAAIVCTSAAAASRLMSERAKSRAVAAAAPAASTADGSAADDVAFVGAVPFGSDAQTEPHDAMRARIKAAGYAGDTFTVNVKQQTPPADDAYDVVVRCGASCADALGEALASIATFTRRDAIVHVVRLSYRMVDNGRRPCRRDDATESDAAASSDSSDASATESDAAASAVIHNSDDEPFVIAEEIEKAMNAAGTRVAGFVHAQRSLLAAGDTIDVFIFPPHGGAQSTWADTTLKWAGACNRIRRLRGWEAIGSPGIVDRPRAVHDLAQAVRNARNTIHVTTNQSIEPHQLRATISTNTAALVRDAWRGFAPCTYYVRMADSLTREQMRTAISTIARPDKMNMPASFAAFNEKTAFSSACAVPAIVSVTCVHEGGTPLLSDLFRRLSRSTDGEQLLERVLRDNTVHRTYFLPFATGQQARDACDTMQAHAAAVCAANNIRTRVIDIVQRSRDTRIAYHSSNVALLKAALGPARFGAQRHIVDAFAELAAYVDGRCTDIVAHAADTDIDACRVAIRNAFATFTRLYAVYTSKSPLDVLSGSVPSTTDEAARAATIFVAAIFFKHVARNTHADLSVAVSSDVADALFVRYGHVCAGARAQSATRVEASSIATIKAAVVCNSHSHGPPSDAQRGAIIDALDRHVRAYCAPAPTT